MVEYPAFEAAALDDTYGALAHPVRRAMLDGLADRPARVTELAAPFRLSLAAASKHVRVLEAAGLVRRDVVGREHWISLDGARLADASAWLDRYRRFWEGRLDALDQLLLERRRRDGP
jgi:DNA-binding transcriptional ArsR family regulator